MSFLQFFVWEHGWLPLGITGFGQWLEVLNLERCFQPWIASIIMPALTGIIADRWINAEKLYGILHLKRICYFYIPQVVMTLLFSLGNIFWLWCFICLPFCLIQSYNILNNNFDVVKVFPPIRVWELLVLLPPCGWLIYQETRRQLICFIFPVCFFNFRDLFFTTKCPADKTVIKMRVGRKIGIRCL
jgi:NHS family xanthosine MFS transporter